MRFIYFVVVALFSTANAASLQEIFRAPAENNCQTIMDLFIVLDSSGSIGAPAFEQAKNSLVDMVSKLQVGPKKVQIWVINYGSIVETPISFHNMPTSEYTKESLIKKIRAIRYMDGSCTATGDALRQARTICDKHCRDFRSGAARVALVFTDGNSNCGASVGSESAFLFSSTKASVFAVGIGYGINNAELQLIATEKRYVVHVNNYLELTTAINNITVQTCGIPAFVIPNVKVESEVDLNTFRYYQVNTMELRQSQKSQGGFVEITSHVTDGAVEVYTSTTEANPGPKTGKRAVLRTRGADQYYVEFIEQGTDRLYFSFHGLREKNEYDFVVEWTDMNGGIIG